MTDESLDMQDDRPEVPSPATNSAALSSDALEWANEFMRLFGNRRYLIDKDLMLGWFANAMMKARDAAENSTKAPPATTPVHSEDRASEAAKAICDLKFILECVADAPARWHDDLTTADIGMIAGIREYWEERFASLKEWANPPVVDTRWTIWSALQQIASCGFKCEAGPLSNNVAWKWLNENLTGTGGTDYNSGIHDAARWHDGQINTLRWTMSREETLRKNQGGKMTMSTRMAYKQQILEHEIAAREIRKLKR